MKKLTTEQLGEMATTTSSILMAIIFGWSLSAVEPVTVSISAIMLIILLSIYGLLIVKRVKS